MFFQMNFCMLVLLHTCARHRAREGTCRVVAGSLSPLGDGVIPSIDAGVTGEEAMSPPPRHSLYAGPGVTFCGVLRHAAPLREDRAAAVLSNTSTVALCPATVEPLPLLRTVLVCL